MSDKIKFYNSNQNLKGAGQKLQWSQDELREFLKCADDVIYFINTYCKIVSLDQGLVDFKLYPCQEKKIKIIHSLFIILSRISID